ncbi:hypothetical protein [Stratiformator vulcanicus]|uniref:Uncharacterized protein n=1 Tax=Stratiformator vulcanicus TaxID=2527980 RepID=A0A517QVR4_9PLAN|nr:hypothetical protein [Stratiformator vulcanicus]QDT35711.1 hypothetical protein Pan189_00640 [Stratiformator vulcanicus]
MARQRSAIRPAQLFDELLMKDLGCEREFAHDPVMNDSQSTDQPSSSTMEDDMMSSLRDRMRGMAEDDSDDFDESLFDRKPFWKRWGLRLAIWPILAIVCGLVYTERSAWLEAKATAIAWKEKLGERGRANVSALKDLQTGNPMLKVEDMKSYPLVQRRLHSAANVYTYTWTGLAMGFNIRVYVTATNQVNKSARILAIEGPTL